MWALVGLGFGVWGLGFGVWGLGEVPHLCWQRKRTISRRPLLKGLGQEHM